MEKILILIQDYPSMGGVATVSEQLAAALCDKGYLVEWMAWRKENANAAHFPCRYLPDPSDANSASNRAFLKQFIEENDIRFILDQGAWTFLYADFAGSDRHFYICIYHLDPDWLLYRHRMNRKGSSPSWEKRKRQFRPKAVLRSVLSHSALWNRWRVRRQLRASLRDSAAVVVLSRTYRDKLLKLAGLCQDAPEARKIHVVGNPVRPLNFPKADSFSHRALLYAGRFSRADKRLDRLLEAWSHLEQRWPEWRLILRGSGPDERRLRRLVEKQHLTRVCFEPPCAPESLYEGASLYCLTSFCEGFNVSLLEAQSRGLVPVVAFASGYEYEAVLEGASGRVVASHYHRCGRMRPPQYHSFDVRAYAEALSALMSDEEKRRSMSEEARLWAACFSMEHFLPLWEELLEGLSADKMLKQRLPADDCQNIQVLVSTCGKRIGRLENMLPEPRPNVRYAVSWQCSDREKNGLVPMGAWSARPDVVCETAASTGISANRNHTLQMAYRLAGLHPSLSWILDDDVRILPEAYQRIRAGFRQHPEVDVACFQIITPEGISYHPYPESECGLRTLDDLRRFSSIEIVFRTERVLAAGITFDERFGLGRPWPCSEEFLFLVACQRAGLRLHYFPYPIVEHPAASTTHSLSPYEDALLQKSGAVNTLLFGRPWAYLRHFLSLLKALPALRHEGISARHFLQMKNQGSREA